MIKKLTVAGWLFCSSALFLYSFTQVDLGLTLTSTSTIAGIQQSFQYIGYFNRSLSALIFTLLVLLLFLMYVITMRLVHHRFFRRQEIWAIIISVSVILFLSYNAFSYDLFNYIFDAKIVTFYHQDPYTHKALDYPGDPMLGFMHWTHRTYPYGPLWLWMTLPLSYIGGSVFIVTYYLFKLFLLGCFLVGCYFLEKLLHVTKTVDPLFGLVFFALNPLILIEFLVSAHNDIAMMALAVVALYLAVTGRRVLSLVILGASVAVKFATIFLLPVFLLLFWYQAKKEKKKIGHVLFLSVVAMVIPVIFASLRTNFQPWYLVYALPFASLFSKRYYIFIPTIVFSLLAIFNYLPFLFTGNWDPPIPTILLALVWSSVIVSLMAVLYYYLRYNRSRALAQKKS